MYKRFGFGLMAAAGVVLLSSTSAMAYTASEIVATAVDNLDNISDYSASVDAANDTTQVTEMSGATLQWKRASGLQKMYVATGTPFTAIIVTDGTAWNTWDTTSQYSRSEYQLYYASDSGMTESTHGQVAWDFFDTLAVLSNHTWSLDDNTYTVNSVECYRLYCTGYEVWIDTATRTKVVRLKEYDASSVLLWQMDYSDYSNVQSIAQVPATIKTSKYDGGVLQWTADYSFTDITLNQSLSDNVFAVTGP